MQRITRSNTDNTLVQVEDPEQILRERRRSMAEQAEQGRGNPRVTRDSDGEEYSEAEEVNTRDLYVQHAALWGASGFWTRSVLSIA